MSKGFGSTRIVKPYNYDRQLNINQFYREIKTGDYLPNYSHVSAKTGAYVLFQKGHNYHIEEMEVADALADSGYNVKLTPEGDNYEMYATRIKKDGTYKFSEGTISMFTYEQKTTSVSGNKVASVSKAINHAIDKGAKIALIYDRHGVLHRKDIAEGMKYNQSKSMKWKTNKLIVMVVNKKREVFEHHFDE